MQPPACQPGEGESRGQWLTGNLLLEMGHLMMILRNNRDCGIAEQI